MPLDFPSQIVQPPQVLSHLLCNGRYSAFSQFTSFSCCVSRCVSPFCLPGAAFATAHRPAHSEQWSFGGEQFQAPPRWDTTGAIDFPSQIVKSPQVLSHLLSVVAIFPLPHPCAIRFPKSNRQISTSPISSAFSGRCMSLFFPCHTHVPLDFPSQIVKPPQVLSHLLCSGRYSSFSHFTSFSCCVSRCASPLCLPGAAFATADRPARSEQWSFGGEQFQAPPRWDTTGAIDFPSQIVKSPQILSHLL